MEAYIYDIKKVARYIALSLLTKQMTVSLLKLQKLLYYAQAWSMDRKRIYTLIANIRKTQKN